MSNMAKTPTNETTPLAFEVEIESGGRAHDIGASTRTVPVVLSPVRAAAKARARRRAVIMIASAAVLLVGIVGWVLISNPALPDDAVARVNGELIYQRDIEKRLDFNVLFNELSKLPVSGPPSAASKLEEIISERMQIQDAKKAGVKVTAQEIDAEVGQVETSTGNSPQQMNTALAKHNLAMDDLRLFSSNALLIKKYIEQYVVAGAATQEDAQNRQNEWLTSLAQTSKIERFKAPGSGPAPRVGSEAPDFTLKDMNGKEVKLSSLRGRPVMLNFWATWCPPCRAEIPIIAQMYNDTHKSGSQSSNPYEIVGIATQSDQSTIKAFAQEFNMAFPILPDVDSQVVSAYQVLPIPTSFFIDKNGIVRYIQTGMVDRPLLEQWLLGK